VEWKVAAILRKLKLAVVAALVITLAVGTEAPAARTAKPRADDRPVQTEVREAAVSSRATGSLGTLAFDGLDLALAVGGGLAVVLGGVAVGRAVKRRRE
jgi:hypothetical protein